MVRRPPPDGAAAAVPSWPPPRYIGTRLPSRGGDVVDGGGTTTGDGGDGDVPRSARTTGNSCRRRHRLRPRRGARVSTVLDVEDAVAVADAALVVVGAVGGAGAGHKIPPCDLAVLPDDRTLYANTKTQ